MQLIMNTEWTNKVKTDTIKKMLAILGYNFDSFDILSKDICGNRDHFLINVLHSVFSTLGIDQEYYLENLMVKSENLVSEKYLLGKYILD